MLHDGDDDDGSGGDADGYDDDNDDSASFISRYRLNVLYSACSASDSADAFASGLSRSSLPFEWDLQGLIQPSPQHLA